LDRLLTALVEKNAQALVMAEGRAPEFVLGGARKPVSQKTLDRNQIARLLAELSEEVDLARLTGQQPLQFIYQPPRSNVLFRCSLADREGALRAELVPMSVGEQTEAVEPTVEAPQPPPAAAVETPSEAIPTAVSTVSTVRAGAPEIERYLHQMAEVGASDLHLSAGQVPMFRLDGEMSRVPGADRVGPEKVDELVDPIMPDKNRQEYAQTHDTDFSYEIPGLARFRVNVFADRHGRGAVFRLIPSQLLTVEQLGLPKSVLDLCQLSKGLVLVTGPTGSGKSTTLATMIDHVNRTRSDHIITIEDPVEFVHANQKCLVNQREVHSHTQSFKRALRAALREDPDIVLVGEMRDLETIAIAIETAETGHLVFGTLHTSTAVSTVDRIIDQFPADRQAQIRTMLSESIKGVVSQNLLKKIGGGRVAAMEVLIVTPAIANLIREGKNFQIPSLMQTGRKHGMVLLNDALFELVKSKKVEPRDAYRVAVDKTSLAGQFAAAGISFQPDSA